jgi:carboxyl-terminal processing protease
MEELMKRPVYISSLFGILVCSLVLVTVRNVVAESGESDSLFNEHVIRQVHTLIYRNYVEEPVDFSKELYFGSLIGMTDVLDPHSQFLPPEDREELEIDTQGHFGGLGIVIEKPAGKNGPIVIITPFLGTPASKAGIQPGDRIVKIEGKSTIGMDLSEAVDMLRGEPGSEVTIEIQRGVRQLSRALNAGRFLQGCRLVSIDGDPSAGKKDSEISEYLQAKRGERVMVEVVPEQLAEPESVTVARAEIKVPSIEFKRIVDRRAGIGYIHLARFQEDSARMLEAAIDELRLKGMKALVLDLRSNPGGLLNAAIRISDMFLSEGIIVSTRARGVNPGAGAESVFRAKPGDEYDRTDLPLAVLVDGSSASASEILAAAIKDNRRGLVIGSRTFGKGSVQKLFDIPLGRDPETGKRLLGSLKLTTEKYYTPSGTSIQREPGKEEWGVEPDIAIEMSESEMIDLRRQWEKDKIAENKTGEIPADEDDANGASADKQLGRALEILRAVLLLSEPGAARAVAAPASDGVPAEARP